MNTFAPLFQSILDSSVWDEPYHVRIVWTAILALKESDHVVRTSAYKLAKRANVTEQEVLDALKVLSSPDTRRIEPQPHDGRRIHSVEDGWLVLNGQKYEEEMQKLKMRIYKARKAREYRRKGLPLPGEPEPHRAETPEEHDRRVTRHLPQKLQETPPGYHVSS